MCILQRVSLTVGRNQIVDEIVITFTHTTVVDWMIPGIAPTGKKVESIVVVIAGVKDKKISHEHIYCDQASVLFQIGLIDPHDLPICGAESARKLLVSSIIN
jgi:carboxymethylenebutenolidase